MSEQEFDPKSDGDEFDVGPVPEPGFDLELATAMTDAHLAIEAAFAAVAALPAGPLVLDGVAEIEVLRRRVEALGVAVAGRVDREGLFRLDGHRSAAASVAHRANTSKAEARRRREAARTVGEMPTVGTWFDAGSIGTCHIRTLAGAHANPRVRDALVACDEIIADSARTMTCAEFGAFIADFVRMVDQDGTADRNDKNHAGRDVRLTQRPDLGWDLQGAFGALQGARFDEIFEAFVYAELCADWETARAEHGDAACEGHLPRTPGQRRADALACVFDAAAVSPEAPDGCRTETTIVFDPTTWERALAWLQSGRTEPVDPATAAHTARRGAMDCRTGNGIPLEPREAAAQSLVGTLRRVVVDARGVPLDRSRPVRLFGGALRAAIQTVMVGCTWPGCGRPVGSCQLDHIDSSSRGGETSGDNAGVLCGHHNRLKNRGFRTWRDPTGSWHTYRPDGTEIPWSGR